MQAVYLMFATVISCINTETSETTGSRKPGLY